MKKKGGKQSLPTKDIAYWKKQYGIQKLLSDTLVSLLDKYGSTLESRSLQREFVLTLMGHYLVGDACYYEWDEEIGILVPVVHYGRMRPNKPIERDCTMISSLIATNTPITLEEQGDKTAIGGWPDDTIRYAALMAPLMLEAKFLGVLLLGAKVSRLPYTASDIEILKTLCSFSAVTFNNARLYQNAMASYEEVKRVLELRSEMVSRIDHEFRTPLTIIKGGLELLESHSELQPIGRGISQATENLEKLISSLLELHKSDIRREATLSARLSPFQLVSEVISAHSDHAGKRGISIVTKDSTMGASVDVRSDRESLRTVVDVLITNAIKYSRESAPVEIRIRIGDPEPRSELGTRISGWREGQSKMLDRYGELIGRKKAQSTTVIEKHEPSREEGDTSGPSSRYLVISVQDSGIGIPKDDLAFLGQPFSQASNSPDKGIKGKALGLALAQRVLERSGGSLYCRSAEGEGSLFTVLVPLA